MFGRLSRTSLGLITLLGAGSLAYSVAIEPRVLRLRQFRTGIPGLPAELEGLRVAFLSDFHVGGPGQGRNLTSQALDLVAQEQPDLILLGGDYFDKGHWDNESGVFDALSAFPRVVGVLGNHDQKRGEGVAERVCRGMEQRGVTILRNSTITLRLRDCDVTIAGVDDPYSNHDDLERTLRGSAWPLILLAHAPVIESSLEPGMAGLVLTGHTHGGQIRLSPAKMLTPLDSTFYLDRVMGRRVSKYQRGFHWVRGNLLYVSNGIGTTRLPIRFMAPPEVTIFHLSREAPHSDKSCDSADRYVEDIG
ncbi:MAG TPA: metallophosphoesterase [Nitrolancea sp.]|nr:metallophosphoesterase [Nitrolancea sp.]